jgi:hypothetical protein
MKLAKTVLFLILLIVKTITGFAQDQQKIEYPNLIKNGDFENGNTGFKSDFIFAQENSWNVGYYLVTDNVSPYLEGMAFGNPVPNTGKYFAVRVDANWNQRLWYDSVTVKPNTTYSFTCMLANISNGLANPAFMKLKVNGKTCSCSSQTLPEGSSEWTPLSMVYTTKSDETRIEISIVDEIVTQTRNDVGLDNIVFKELPEDTTITGELIELGVPTTRSAYIANLSSIVGIEGKIFVFRNNDGSNAYINICYPDQLFNKGFFVIGKKYKIACTKTQKTQINSCSVYNPKNYTNLLFEQSIVRLD